MPPLYSHTPTHSQAREGWDLTAVAGWYWGEEFETIWMRWEIETSYFIQIPCVFLGGEGGGGEVCTKDPDEERQSLPK